MPYNTPDRYPCPFCETALNRLEHVCLFEARHAIAEVSDCERTPNGGSILVWPKQHVETISQLGDCEALDIMQMLFRASASIINAFGLQGMHTFCSAGTLVGQSEAHMHFQIQPRYSDRPYSFAPARELPTISLSTRAEMAAALRHHGSDLPLFETVRGRITFRDELMPAPTPRTCIEPELIIEETNNFVALCHPQARSVGAVVVMAKRDISCFLELAAHEHGELMLLIRNVASAVEHALSPDGLSVWWDTGAEADQAGRDFLVEIVPRFEHIPYTHQHRRDMDIGPKEIHLDTVAAYRRQLLRRDDSIPLPAEDRRSMIPQKPRDAAPAASLSSIRITSST